ncbi:MAG: ZIP family metal transporter [Candidatus Micrarchaeota archaeon]
MDIIIGALAVLIATSVGAAASLFIGCVDQRKNAVMLSFSAGAMAFSALEMLNESHRTADGFQMLFGFAVGLAVLVTADKILPHVHHHLNKREIERAKKKALLLGGAIALHNIPEGLSIATAFASSASLGWFVTTIIAVQDIPEGALIAVPLVCCGLNRRDATLYGVLSGLVEAGAAIAGFMLLSLFSPLIPSSLAFSAGAMAYVVLVELLPDAFSKGNERAGAISFAAGAGAAFLIATQLF